MSTRRSRARQLQWRTLAALLALATVAGTSGGASAVGDSEASAGIVYRRARLGGAPVRRRPVPDFTSAAPIESPPATMRFQSVTSSRAYTPGKS
jgi:hypothetical protein